MTAKGPVGGEGAVGQGSGARGCKAGEGTREARVGEGGAGWILGAGVVGQRAPGLMLSVRRAWDRDGGMGCDVGEREVEWCRKGAVWQGRGGEEAIRN